MAAAAATKRLRIGTGICLVAERDPIVTAKAAASVDRLSGGRLLFGVGAGWNLEEMRNHGTDPERRFGIMRERVEAIKTIWTEDEASYHGRHVDFDRIWCWPKPLQQPHPPILVGGHGSQVRDRVLAFGDEWMPNRIGDDDRIIARIERLRAAGREAGRGEIGVTLCNVPHEPEVIERYATAGVNRFVFWLAPGDADALERRLDRVAATSAAVTTAPNLRFHPQFIAPWKPAANCREHSDQGVQMSSKLKKVLAGVAALAALALGGAALAQAGGGSDQSTAPAAASDSSATESENEPGEAQDASEPGEAQDAQDEAGQADDQDQPGEAADSQESGQGHDTGDDGDQNVTGSGADQATAAALEITNGGTANSVERDSENGATWEVEVTKPDGSTVDVRLDENYKLVVVEGDSGG